jgi:hypothetical protein
MALETFPMRITARKQLLPFIEEGGDSCRGRTATAISLIKRSSALKLVGKGKCQYNILPMIETWE